MGFQNTTAFEQDVRYVQLFKELGVGVAQLTYNTQQWVGSGCYESTDGGLSDFDREVVASSPLTSSRLAALHLTLSVLTILGSPGL